jgi:hypothetical protein
VTEIDAGWQRIISVMGRKRKQNKEVLSKIKELVREQCGQCCMRNGEKLKLKWMRTGKEKLWAVWET